MQPALTNKLVPHTFSDILKCFGEGKPLSAEQMHFLRWHQRALSSSIADPVLKYYLKSTRKQPQQKLSVLFPKQKINDLTFQQIKQRVHTVLKNNLSHTDLKMTMQQYLQFKAAGIDELIFWHGNQFLTGAPFFAGGLPYVVYFQWGNLFGVVKFQVLSEDKALKGNVLIYFEDMQERYLSQCVADYTKHLQQSSTPTLAESQQETLIVQPNYSTTPTLTFGRSAREIDEKK